MKKRCHPRCYKCGRFVRTDDLGAFVCDHCKCWSVVVTVEGFQRYGNVLFGSEVAAKNAGTVESAQKGSVVSKTPTVRQENVQRPGRSVATCCEPGK